MSLSIPTLSFDLSNYNSPIANIFEQPKTAKEWEKYMLTEEQVKSYEEKGYISGIQILTNDQVDMLNMELEKLLSVGGEEKKLFYHYETNESEDPGKVLF